MATAGGPGTCSSISTNVEEEETGEQPRDNFIIRAHNRTLHGFNTETESEWVEPFYFIQGADTQLGMFDTFRTGDTCNGDAWVEELELCRKAVDAANRINPKPKFFVVCGDLVNAMPGYSNKAKQEADFKAAFSRLSTEIPLVCICGNHDVGNSPTMASIANYRNKFGDDFFSFWVAGVKFLVLNSQLYEDSSQVPHILEEQDRWLDEELSANKTHGAKHIVIFQHIPWFLESPDEPKNYFNIDINTRKKMMEKFKRAGVRIIFCGHYHRNAGGFDEDLEVVVTSAIGAQLGEDKSGMRIVKVTEQEINHQYHELDNFPDHVDFDK